MVLLNHYSTYSRPEPLTGAHWEKLQSFVKYSTRAINSVCTCACGKPFPKIVPMVKLDKQFLYPSMETLQPILPYSIQKPPCHVEIVDDSLHRSSDDYWLKKHPHETFPRVLLSYNGLI